MLRWFIIKQELTDIPTNRIVLHCALKKNLENEKALENEDLFVSIFTSLLGHNIITCNNEIFVLKPILKKEIQRFFITDPFQIEVNAPES